MIADCVLKARMDTALTADINPRENAENAMKQVVIQPDLTTTFAQWGFMLSVENGRLAELEGLGGITQPEDRVPILHPDDRHARWREFLWMHYTAVLLTLEGGDDLELLLETCGGQRRVRVADLATHATAIQTGDDGRLFIALYDPLTEGRASITPAEVTAGSRQNYTIEFTIGDSGIATGGGLRVYTPYSSWSAPEMTGGSVTLTRADGSAHDAVIEAHLRPHSHPVFGFYYAIRVLSGRLAAGDVLRIHYASAEGIRAQTYPKERVYFSTFLDARACGIHYSLSCAATPAVKIRQGEAHRLRIVAPMAVRQGEPFTVRGLALDRHYNPTRQKLAGPVTLEIRPLASVEGDQVVLGETAELTTPTDADGKFAFEGVSINQPGYYSLTARSGDLEPATLVVKAAESEIPGLFWGSIHGHSEMSDGEFGPEEYFRYGREDGLVDFCALTDHDWELFEHYRNRALGGFPRVQKLAERYNEPGRYVTLSAYEWMGVNQVGHINVYYNNARTDNPMYVGEIAILDRTDANTPGKLVEIYKGRDDVLLIPHTSHGTTWPVWDPQLMRLVEIYSCWGCSEDKLYGAGGTRAGLDKGFELGFIGGADSHHGSPGHTGLPSKYHCLPDREGFAAVYADAFTRDGIFRAMQARRCYATTGERILLEFSVGGHTMGQSVKVEGGGELAVRGVAGGTHPMEKIELIADGEPVAEGRVEGLMGYLDTSLTPRPGKHYYYLRATQKDGERAWSSPVWLES